MCIDDLSDIEDFPPPIFVWTIRDDNPVGASVNATVSRVFTTCSVSFAICRLIVAVNVTGVWLISDHDACRSIIEPPCFASVAPSISSVLLEIKLSVRVEGILCEAKDLFLVSYV